jgi:site-specific recombinase XerD
MRGVDLYVVRDLLGHSSIALTERYAHLHPSAHTDAVKVLG